MKIDQLILWIIIGFVVYKIACAFFELYDEITYEIDPATGKQKMNAHKNRVLEGQRR